ncbi:DNA-directed RNA polymerase [Paraburkholderia susongensis]|uniref:DNA-directed RNA polymerase n=1 Tax=Paraburkholderia susongensis TaxID=1515439 RepID=A0A1X7KQZ2_9BURK|nr:DNA-directed RNA polymerase [Paraburkholderia susongensis]SMG43711.1 DNA-directed RNA polymerase [Paraburkholderia susongensis]
MTTTADLHALQIELEEEAIGLGMKRYNEQMANGEDTLPPGLKLMKAAIEPTAAAIEKFIEDGLAGTASRSVGIIKYLDQFEDRKLVAFVTAKVVFNHMGKMSVIGAVAGDIANRLEDCLNFDALKAAEPGLYKQLLKKIEKTRDERHRHIVLRVQQKFAKVATIKWGVSEKMRLGTALIHLFAEATGLVEIQKYVRGANDTPYIVAPTEATAKWLADGHARCALMSPMCMPMVVKPLPWTGPLGGGYLTKPMRFPLIKTANRNYLEDLKQVDMPMVYRSINALQETPWAINKAVFHVMREVWDGGGRLGKLPAREPQALPPKHFDLENPDPEELKAWKKQAAGVYEGNIRGASKRAGMSSKLWMAEKFEDIERFFYVHNLDWRGRAYPVATFLNPQGSDSDKALLQFADGYPLGENGARWLAIHGANTFGIDKVAFEERVQWVEDHHDQILEAAMNPLDGSRWWADADSPYMFLAFCYEWLALSMHTDMGKAQEEFLSYLPCSWDGACNGLQNFSALLKDEVGGAAVGLVPSDKPSDIYSEVAKAANMLMAEDAAEGSAMGLKWQGKMTRKLAKPNTMTTPYGATKRGMCQQVEGVFQKMKTEAAEQGTVLEVTADLKDCQYLADTNYQAIGKVVVAAHLAMDWLRDAAKVAASDSLPIHWVTPSGLLVLQDYREMLGQALDFTVAGKRVQMMLKNEGDKLDRRKQSAGISPNFIHSLDAAHMMRTVNYCLNHEVTHFAMIHDSYGAHAGLADTLRNCLRRAFVDQYSGEVLADFRNQLANQLPPELAAELPPLPPSGSLDLEDVMHSEYFFA